MAVIMTTSNLEARIRDGMQLPSEAFVAQTLSQIHSPGNPSFGSDFNNMCAALCALPAEARNFVKMLAESSNNTCFRLLVEVVENWIKAMADIFPKMAAGIQNAQIDFDSGRELRLQSFVAADSVNLFIPASGSLAISESFLAVCRYALAANAMAVPKLPSYPPLHLFGGAVEHANSGGESDGGDDKDGDILCSLERQISSSVESPPCLCE